MLELKNASFHYSLARLNLKNECIFYDAESQLYRNFPKQTSNKIVRKLSVHEIIQQSRKFCRCDDPDQFNFLLSESFLQKLGKIAKHVNRHLDKMSLICKIFNKVFNWFRLGVFATTADIVLLTRDAVERQTFYLLGRKLSFTIFNPLSQ